LDYIRNIKKKFLQKAIEFGEDDITTVLTEIGLLSNTQKCRIEELEKYIFLYGDSQEIYVAEERQFIENVGLVYIYQDIYKKTKKGVIPCRLIAAELCAKNDLLRDCIFLMKVINKAVGGFNIFFIKSRYEFYIGCRLFNKNENNNCFLSRPIENKYDLEEISQNILYIPITDEFLPYYNALLESFNYKEDFYEDYESYIAKKRGVKLSYPKMLSELEMIYSVNLNYERERYFRSFEEHQIIKYSDIINDTLESLSFIKSSKVNTLEMLFEAEEIALISDTVEEENKSIFTKQYGNNSGFDLDYEEDKKMKEYLDDPGKMIVLLKQKKGL
jgi:hypothetical protein